MRTEDLFGGKARPLPSDYSANPDVVAAVRAQDWDLWAAWLLGEDPAPALEHLPPKTRTAYGEWLEKWYKRAHELPEGLRCALDRWHWVSGAAVARSVSTGSALYVVSRGRLRLRIDLDISTSVLGRSGRAASLASGLRFARLCTRESRYATPDRSHPLRCGCPIAFEPLTLEQDVPSPRGMRRRWWPRAAEIPCPDWRGAAEGGS